MASPPARPATTARPAWTTPPGQAAGHADDRDRLVGGGHGPRDVLGLGLVQQADQVVGRGRRRRVVEDEGAAEQDSPVTVASAVRNSTAVSESKPSSLKGRDRSSDGRVAAAGDGRDLVAYEVEDDAAPLSRPGRPRHARASEPASSCGSVPASSANSRARVLVGQRREARPVHVRDHGQRGSARRRAGPAR